MKKNEKKETKLKLNIGFFEKRIMNVSRRRIVVKHKNFFIQIWDNNARYRVRGDLLALQRLFDFAYLPTEITSGKNVDI